MSEPLRTLADIEREHVLAVYQHHQKHIAKTAKTLGISRTTLYRKLQALKAWTPVVAEKRTIGFPGMAKEIVHDVPNKGDIA